MCPATLTPPTRKIKQEKGKEEWLDVICHECKSYEKHYLDSQEKMGLFDLEAEPRFSYNSIIYIQVYNQTSPSTTP